MTHHTHSEECAAKDIPSFAEEETSTSSREECPVSQPQPLEKERGQAMTVGSGQKLLEYCESLNLHSPFLRTCAASLLLSKVWYSTACSLSWKKMAMKSNRFVFQLAPSVRRTKEKESGLLPTINTSDRHDANLKNGHDQKKGYLRGEIAMLPTPTTRDWKGARKPETLAAAGRTASNSLEDSLVAMLQTPSATCIHERSEESMQKRIKWRASTGRKSIPPGNLAEQIAMGGVQDMRYGKKGGYKLQPAFAAWMMGFPENWTESAFQSGEKKA